MAFERKTSRKSIKLIFSREPQPEPIDSHLQSLKKQFQLQLREIIQIQKIQQEGYEQIAYRNCKILELDLSPKDFDIIRFSVSEYKEKYTELGYLGEGCIGLVKAAERNCDKSVFAVKIVKTSDEEIIRSMILEFKNLQKLIHINIVKMHEIYIDLQIGIFSMSTVYIIMEKVEGKEMFEVIQQIGHYNGQIFFYVILQLKLESIARQIFKQILEAIKFMHQNYCCHRDLKPNNILCSEDGELVKIADFNVSKFSESYKEFSNLNEQGRIEMWTYTGTVAFSAPEILSGSFYNESVDMWSAGIILFTMLSGNLPFTSLFLNDLIEQIIRGEFNFNSNIWENVSDQAKNLITGMLQVESSQRMTPEEALDHPWFQEVLSGHTSSSSEVSEHLGRNINSLVNNKKKRNNSESIRKVCFLFGAGEIWKRNTVVQSTNILYDDFRRTKTFDLPSQQIQGELKVVKEEGNKNVYNIQIPDFSSDDEDEQFQQ